MKNFNLSGFFRILEIPPISEGAAWTGFPKNGLGTHPGPFFYRIRFFIIICGQPSSRNVSPNAS